MSDYVYSLRECDAVLSDRISLTFQNKVLSTSLGRQKFLPKIQQNIRGDRLSQALRESS
jgi:hypothetical protein